MAQTKVQGDEEQVLLTHTPAATPSLPCWAVSSLTRSQNKPFSLNLPSVRNFDTAEDEDEGCPHPRVKMPSRNLLFYRAYFRCCIYLFLCIEGVPDAHGS